MRLNKEEKNLLNFFESTDTDNWAIGRAMLGNYPKLFDYVFECLQAKKNICMILLVNLMNCPYFCGDFESEASTILEILESSYKTNNKMFFYNYFYSEYKKFNFIMSLECGVGFSKIYPFTIDFESTKATTFNLEKLKTDEKKDSNNLSNSRRIQFD